MGRATKDKRDIYYRKAKEQGWRARSAFKLLHLDEQFGLLQGVHNVVDLCAAPGSWSQVLSRKVWAPAAEDAKPRIVAVDLQPMAPIPGVTHIQGDITSAITAEAVIAQFDGCRADLVDVTGLHDMDEYVQSELILAALGIVIAVLKPHGTFVAKIFRGKSAPVLFAKLRNFFTTVSCAKPKSSRNSSWEAFVVCQDFSVPDLYRGQEASLRDALTNWSSDTPLTPLPLTPDPDPLIPFVACGDLRGYDADMSYELSGEDDDYTPLDPVQPPTDPPYRAAIELLKRRPAAGRSAE